MTDGRGRSAFTLTKRTCSLLLTRCLCCSVPVAEEERKSTSSGEDEKLFSTESLPVQLSSKPPEGEEPPNAEKSASQPNITNIPPPKVGPLPLVPNRSSYPLSGSSGSSTSSSGVASSMYSSTSTGSSPSLSGTTPAGLGFTSTFTPGTTGFTATTTPTSGFTSTTTPENTSHVVDSYFLDDDRLDKSPEDLGLGDLEHDINSALEEIMSGVKSLELQQKEEPPEPSSGSGMLPKFPVGNLKETPDLVLDLPVGDEVKEQPSPKSIHSSSSIKSSGTSSTDSDSPTLSTAELFANNNQCTMKKGASASMPRGVTPPGGGTGKLPGSPGQEVKRSYSTAGTVSTRGKYQYQKTHAVEIEAGDTIWESQKPGMVARRTPPPPPKASRQTPSPGPTPTAAPAMATERLLGMRSHSPIPGLVPGSGPTLTSGLGAVTSGPNTGPDPTATTVVPGPQGPVPVPTPIPHPAPRLTPVTARKDRDSDPSRDRDRDRPTRPEKPKPPPKSMKPPLMKKPTRSPEVPRKVDLTDADMGKFNC